MAWPCKWGYRKKMCVCVCVHHPSKQTIEQFKWMHVNICCIECGDKIMELNKTKRHSHETYRFARNGIGFVIKNENTDLNTKCLRWHSKQNCCDYVHVYVYVCFSQPFLYDVFVHANKFLFSINSVLLRYSTICLLAC